MKLNSFFLFGFFIIGACGPVKEIFQTKEYNSASSSSQTQNQTAPQQANSNPTKVDAEKPTTSNGTAVSNPGGDNGGLGTTTDLKIEKSADSIMELLKGKHVLINSKKFPSSSRCVVFSSANINENGTRECDVVSGDSVSRSRIKGHCGIDQGFESYSLQCLTPESQSCAGSSDLLSFMQPSAEVQNDTKIIQDKSGDYAWEVLEDGGCDKFESNTTSKKLAALFSNWKGKTLAFKTSDGKLKHCLTYGTEPGTCKFMQYDYTGKKTEGMGTCSVEHKYETSFKVKCQNNGVDCNSSVDTYSYFSFVEGFLLKIDTSGATVISDTDRDSIGLAQPGECK